MVLLEIKSNSSILTMVQSINFRAESNFFRKNRKQKVVARSPDQRYTWERKTGAIRHSPFYPWCFYKNKSDCLIFQYKL